MDAAYLGIEDILGAYRTRKLSPVEYVDHVLTQIDRHNPAVNAFFFVEPEHARARAKESEQRWMKGAPIGPLDGIPYSAKDNMMTEGMPSPHGLKVKSNVPPGEADAPIVARLKEAGAILVGKNTQPELACLASCVSGLYGTGRNPWDLSKTPGGSSGGSAAAVAADMVPLSLGGDSGGSIRIPAAFTGTVGLKATFGRIPRLPLAPSAAVHGPMTRKASDMPLVMNAITKPDWADVYSLPYDGADYTRSSVANLKGKKIAVSEWFGYGLPTAPEVSAAFHGALKSVEALGAEVRPVESFFDYDPYEKMAATMAAGFRQMATTYTDGALDTLLPEIQKWAEGGKDATLEDFGPSRAAETAVLVRLAEALKDFDYLLTPTIPVLPYDAELCFPEAATVNRFGHTMSHFPFTWPFNFSGHPAISVPCGFAEGMPVGLQIVGHRGDDQGVIAAAIALEKQLGLKNLRPPLLS